MTHPHPSGLADTICQALYVELRDAVLEPKAKVSDRHLAAWTSVLAAVDALVMVSSGGRVSAEYALSQQDSSLRAAYPQCVHLLRTLQSLHGPQQEASRG